MKKAREHKHRWKLIEWTPDQDGYYSEYVCSCGAIRSIKEHQDDFGPNLARKKDETGIDEDKTA